MCDFHPSVILLDNGHGIETPGKGSPDGSFHEWEWTRCFAAELKSALESRRGADVRLLVPEKSDVPLSSRVARANAFGSGALLLSIHNNAAGMGDQWHSARGFSAFVAPKASSVSRMLAARFSALAAEMGLAGNRYTPPEGYHTASLAICRDTRCPAVLTENLFMDNLLDLRLLKSKAGFDSLLELHIRALSDFL